MSSKLAQMLLADAAIAMSQYLFPTFSEHHRRDVESARRLFRRYLVLAAIGLAALVIVLRLVAEPLFMFVLGPAWLSAVPLFRIFVINMAIGAVIAVLGRGCARRLAEGRDARVHHPGGRAVRDRARCDAPVGRHRHRHGR